jgi:hypothetical protein
MAERALFFTDIGDISVDRSSTRNYTISYERVNRLIIGALVFLATFAWIDVVQTAIQIFILQNPSNALRSGSEEEEREEEGLFLAGWDGGSRPNQQSNGSQGREVERRSRTTNRQRPGQFSNLPFSTARNLAESNRLTLTSKIITAFTITFITIVGVVILSVQDRNATMRLR